jgi:hypothetical protein
LSKPTRPGSSNDHIVPKMYLKRFAVPRAGGHELVAASADTPEAHFTSSINRVGAVKGFYWGTDPQGVPHHHMEAVLTQIEGDAATAFRAVLDSGRRRLTDDVFPARWSPRPEVRNSLAWWIAAQLLRTAPQRERLWALEGEGAAPPKTLEKANPHLTFIIERIAPLAALVRMRPWGIGFTNLCLFTSDVPVQILNSKPEDDPLAAATFWDIYVPLDPHRFLYLPGRMHAANRDLMRDHRIALDGGLAIALNHTMVECSHRHLFWHPHHDPRSNSQLDSVLRMRSSRFATGGSQALIDYAALDDGSGVERRWLDAHPGPDDVAPREATPDLSDSEAIELVTTMMKRLQLARTEYEQVGQERHPR